MKLLHKHKWVGIDKQALYRPAYNSLYGGLLEGVPPSPVTLITEQCEDCKKWRQQELKGWLPEARHIKEEKHTDG